MLTGTPLDLTPFGPLLSVGGLLYWVLAAAAMTLAWRLPRRRSTKTTLTLLVFAVFTALTLIRTGFNVDARGRLNESLALFRERCKSAGEKISRTVDNVQGVVWMRWREEYSNVDNFADQFKLNDPYGRDCGLEDCIASLLRISAGASLNPEEAQRHQTGYAFVDTVDPKDGHAYRYTAHLAHGWTAEQVERRKKESGTDVPSFSYRFTISRVRIPKLDARYGVEWADLSTREDREHWIAGSSLRVIDLQSDEVLGERIGYMLDLGQGNQAGFRSPWLGAQETACPPLVDESGKQTRSGLTLRFVRRVLNPLSGA
jgi:hypothetical protein